MAKNTKNTKNPGAIDKERPAWLQNIIDGLKVIFLTPVALIARIAQRIALGKEGAQRADEEAKADEATRKERAGHEKNAKRMGNEIEQIIQKEHDPLFKHVEIYVPDQSVNGLHYAINVELQNGTRYRDAQDFSLYIDGDNNIVCNDMVPDEVVKHLQELLQRTQLKVRNVDISNEQNQDEQDTHDDKDKGKNKDEHADEEHADEEHTDEEASTDAPEEVPESNEPVIETFGTNNRQLTTVTTKDSITIDGKLDEQEFNLTRALDGNTATLTYNGQVYSVDYNSDMHAIMIEPQSEGALTNDWSESFKAIVAEATSRAFQDEIDAFHNECVSGDGGIPKNGATCEMLAAAGIAHQLPKDALCIIPDAVTNDLVAMQITEKENGKGYSVSTGVMTRNADGEFGNIQYAPEKLVSKLIKPVANPEQMQENIAPAARKLAKAYLDAMNTAHPEEYNILAGNVVYQNLDGKNPQAMATYTPHEGFVTAYVPKSAPHPSHEQMTEIAKMYDSVEGLPDAAKIAEALQAKNTCVIADGVVFQYDATDAVVTGYLAGTDKEYSVPTVGDGNSLENGVKSIFDALQPEREPEVIVNDNTSNDQKARIANEVAEILTDTSITLTVPKDPSDNMSWKEQFMDVLPRAELWSASSRMVDLCYALPNGDEILNASLEGAKIMYEQYPDNADKKDAMNALLESLPEDAQPYVAAFLATEWNVTQALYQQEQAKQLEAAQNGEDHDDIGEEPPANNDTIGDDVPEIGDD